MGDIVGVAPWKPGKPTYRVVAVETYENSPGLMVRITDMDGTPRMNGFGVATRHFFELVLRLGSCTRFMEI